MKQFIVPIKGLDVKEQERDFEITDSFFESFESSPINKGQLSSRLIMSKKFDSLVFNFEIDGKVETDCDRCTANINFPISSEFELIFKFDEKEREEEDIIYIHPDSHEINVSKYLYDHIILSLPMIKVYDCENEDILPCNTKVLDYLDNEQESTANQSRLGEALKNLNFKTK